jgi:hypothetical protein
MNRVALQRAFLASTLRQPRLFERPLALALGVRNISSVADTGFWKSLVPKPLRSRSRTGLKNKSKVHKGWNPATFFIFIFLLIGSMSIQMIALRKDFATFMRQSDVRIGLLREVVEKLQRGEEVDVEKELGTGDAEQELQWEQGPQSLEAVALEAEVLMDAAVLREIEREEPAKSQRKKQPEPTPTPSSEAEAAPSPEETRVPMQSTLASKGFF